MRNLFLGILLILLSAVPAVAQNTGGVFPPGFGDDHETAQYRIAVNTDTNRFAQRLHYQKSIDSKRLWRVVGGTRETDSSDFDFDFVGAELFWELSETTDRWRKGFRFDGIIRGEDRPEQINVNYMNQWTFEDGWSARLIGLSSLQFGDNKRDGILLQPRAQLAKRVADGPVLGLEYYGSLGSTEDISMKRNRQTIGPFISTKLVGKTSILAGAQFGLNNASADADLRLWITQGF